MKNLKYDRIILTITVLMLLIYKGVSLLDISTHTDMTINSRITLPFKDSKITEIEIPSKTIDPYLLTQQIDLLLNDSFTLDELSYLAIDIKIPLFNYSYTYNEDLESLNASTIKVPLNLYIYELAKNDPTILDKKIIYNDSFYEEGSGIMQSTQPGTAFTVRTLLTNSIKYSDNIATNMLFDEFIQSLTVCEELIPYWGEANFYQWTSTIINKMNALEYLYQNQETYSILLDDMINAVYKERSPLYLDDDVITAVKTGDVNSVTHDMMIVFDANNVDYLIAFTLDSIYDKEERMAQLSSDIYDIIVNSIN